MWLQNRRICFKIPQRFCFELHSRKLWKVYPVKPYSFHQRVVQWKTFSILPETHFSPPNGIHPSYSNNHNHNLKNHVLAAAAFTCFLLTLPLCFNSIKHKTAMGKFLLLWRKREKVFLQSSPLTTLIPASTPWITFQYGFWVMLREVNLAALFQGWKFLPDFLSLASHSNLHWSVKHKSGIDWWDFVIIFFFLFRESFDVKDLQNWKILRKIFRKCFRWNI